MIVCDFCHTVPLGSNANRRPEPFHITGSTRTDGKSPSCKAELQLCPTCRLKFTAQLHDFLTDLKLGETKDENPSHKAAEKGAGTYNERLTESLTKDFVDKQGTESYHEKPHADHDWPNEIK